MEERQRRNRSWGQLKFLAALLALVFVASLAVIVGNRLSDEALAVLAGAVCGVGAAIPTSLIIVSVTRRRTETRVQTPARQNQGAYPPVVVVTPPGGQQQQMPRGWDMLPPSLSTPASRQFTVVGEPATEEEATSYGRYP
jgi:hypothetical protein